MVKIKCIICKTEFISERNSKLCCSPECERLRKADYDSNRYLEFRNANRKKRREMLIEKYSISSSNLYKLKSICDECLFEFYADYSIYQGYNDTFVRHYNTTPWGASVCPRCGLVEISACDDTNIHNAKSMNIIEKKLYISNLSRSKAPSYRRQAIYIRNCIDFIAEAEDLRNRRNRINNIGPLTQDEVNECIAILFERLK